MLHVTGHLNTTSSSANVGGSAGLVATVTVNGTARLDNPRGPIVIQGHDVAAAIQRMEASNAALQAQVQQLAAELTALRSALCNASLATGTTCTGGSGGSGSGSGSGAGSAANLTVADTTTMTGFTGLSYSGGFVDPASGLLYGIPAINAPVIISCLTLSGSFADETGEQTRATRRERALQSYLSFQWPEGKAPSRPRKPHSHSTFEFSPPTKVNKLPRCCCCIPLRSSSPLLATHTQHTTEPHHHPAERWWHQPQVSS